MMDYKELCERKLRSMNNEEYNRYYSLYMDASRGNITWEQLWTKHLKDHSSKIKIRDVI